MTNREFNKYDKHGAYHWNWYKYNIHKYRDYAFQTISYFPKKGKLLDVGCGDGLISYLFFQKGFCVTGIDVNRKAIELAWTEIEKRYFIRHWFSYLHAKTISSTKSILKSKGISLQCISINDFPDTEDFDFTICMEVIEHIPNPTEVIDKIKSVTREYIVFSTPNGEYCQPGDEDYQFWTAKEFVTLLGAERTQLLHVDQERIFALLSLQKKYE